MKSGRIGDCAPCAMAGCGGVSMPGSIHCRRCYKRSRERDVRDPLDTPPKIERDVTQVRIKAMRQGVEVDIETQPCVRCGEDAIRGRLYCSEFCRTHGTWANPTLVELHGIQASVREHARRLGVSLGRVYYRMRRGWSVEEALTRPVDTRKQRIRGSSHGRASQRQ